MKINPRAEEPARELFGFAIRSELAEFDEKLASFTDEATLREALRLAAAVSAVVLNDDWGGHTPDESHLQLTATILAEIQDDYRLDRDEVYAYLARCVYGGEPLTEVLPGGAAVTLPFAVAGNLLATHAMVDQGQQWWDYLDAIEDALEFVPDAAESREIQRGLRKLLGSAEQPSGQDTSSGRDTRSD